MPFRNSSINWRNLSFLVGSPIACAIALPLYISAHGFQLVDVVSWALMMTLTGIAITAGYHRYFSHHSYECARAIRAFYLIFGAAALQAPVLDWVSDHRNHHRFVDRDDDPYNIRRGFFWAHMGWTFWKQHSPTRPFAAADLASDRLISLCHRYHLLIGAIVGVSVPFAIGLCFGRPWGGVLWGGLLRVVAAHHSTFLVNSAGHHMGRQPYSRSSSARDSLSVALLTLGEGYHNFHHAFPRDYRNGVRWYHWDPTKWWISSLGVLGLAWKLHRTSGNRISAARTVMTRSSFD